MTERTQKETTTVWEVHSQAISTFDFLVFMNQNDALEKVAELLDEDPGDVRICEREYTNEELDEVMDEI